MTELQATQERITRETLDHLAPEVVVALRTITAAISVSTIGKDLLELIKLRASQINGCAFCLQFHLNSARKLNIPSEKLDLLATWREAGIYSDRERAALDWTEAVTLIAQHHITDELYAEVSRHFSEQEFVFLTAAIGHINYWNRIAEPFRFAPPIPDGRTT